MIVIFISGILLKQHRLKKNCKANTVITIMTTIGKINNIPVENNVLRRGYEVEWKISNFSTLSDVTGTYYHSPIFSDVHIPWYLRIYPNGQSRNKSIGCIGLYLFLGESWSGLPISAEFSLGLKKLHGKKLSEHHYEYIFQSDGRGYGVRGCFCRSELFDEKSDFLPSDVLTVFCNFKYPETVETSSKYYIFVLKNTRLLL